MKYAALLAPLILISTSAPLSATQMTVGFLQKVCTQTDSASVSACSYYILGIFEGTSLAAGIAGDKAHFCVPEGVPLTQMIFAVKKAVGEDLMFYPKDTDIDAAGFIGATIIKQWPCKKPTTN